MDGIPHDQVHPDTLAAIAAELRGSIPMPGDRIGAHAEMTVVASCYYREAGDDSIPESSRDELHDTDLYALIVLHGESPFYSVGVGYWTLDGRWVWTESATHFNINYAVKDYCDHGGDV